MSAGPAMKKHQRGAESSAKPGPAQRCIILFWGFQTGVSYTRLCRFLNRRYEMTSADATSLSNGSTPLIPDLSGIMRCQDNRFPSVVCLLLRLWCCCLAAASLFGLRDTHWAHSFGNVTMVSACVAKGLMIRCGQFLRIRPHEIIPGQARRLVDGSIEYAGARKP